MICTATTLRGHSARTLISLLTLPLTFSYFSSTICLPLMTTSDCYSFYFPPFFFSTSFFAFYYFLSPAFLSFSIFLMPPFQASMISSSSLLLLFLSIASLFIPFPHNFSSPQRMQRIRAQLPPSEAPTGRAISYMIIKTSG